MRIKLIFALIAVLLTAPTAASAEPIKSADNLYMVAGEEFELYFCSAAMRSADLHYRIDRSWIRLAKSLPQRDSTVCKDRMQPIKHSFSFTVPIVYDAVSPTNKYARMMLRTLGPQHTPKLFTAIVFRSQAEKDAAIGSSTTSEAKTNWDKCTYQGRFLSGRVKVVSYDANYRVQLVNQGANLIVTESRGQPIQCGQWQFVNQNYDFTIQLVNEAPDFTISIMKLRGPNR